MKNIKNKQKMNYKIKNKSYFIQQKNNIKKQYNWNKIMQKLLKNSKKIRKFKKN